MLLIGLKDIEGSLRCGVVTLRAGRGRRSGRIPSPHESETALVELSCRKSTITSRGDGRRAGAADGGQAKTAISTPPAPGKTTAPGDAATVKLSITTTAKLFLSFT